MSRSFAVIDGFAEGRWNSKKLRHELEIAGFTEQRDAAKADIIIAHSAGCYFLPQNSKQQTIILIGPPYWPGKPLALSLIQKIYWDLVYRIREGRTGYFFAKTFWNTVYIFSDVARALHIGMYARKHDFIEKMPAKNLILIRNEKDAWCTPDIENIPAHNKIRFFHMPGEHDDCWINTKKYVELLLEEL